MASVIPDKNDLDFKNENKYFKSRDLLKDNSLDIEYKNIDLTKDWTKIDISHHLTDKGLTKFAEDWNKLIGKC
ncbi:MAG: hypothetical protein Q9M91_03200 [Candidatus Dojkabacteria bacterium]|nr:hypothetical protein [Candidatus Dojkabacteria bacterium]